MRIAMIGQPVDSFASSGDDRASVAIVTRQLARRLAARHEVTICARRDPGQAVEDVDAHGIRLRRVSRAGRMVNEALVRLSGVPAVGSAYFASPLYYRGYFRRIARVLGDLRPDVVHFHSLVQHAALIRSHVPEAKLVLHMHGDSLAVLDRATVERDLRAVDLVIGVSEFITRGIQDRFPMFAERCTTLPNGVDIERFRPASSPRAHGSERLLYAGRVSPEKGTHVLLAAFAELLPSHPQAELEVVGSDGLLPLVFLRASRDGGVARALARYYGTTTWRRLRQQLAPSGAYFASLMAALPTEVSARVRRRLATSQRDLADLYRRADVVVLPSICHESFGMSVAEAMASGVPVVVSRSGALPLLVGENSCGLVAERDDAHALARMIAALLDDPEHARKLGTEGRRRAVEMFSWDAIASRLERLYADLLSPLGGGAGAQPGAA